MNSKDEKQTAGVYLGPSFYGIIQKGTVLRGGHSSKMAQLMGAYPVSSRADCSDVANWQKNGWSLESRYSELFDALPESRTD